VRSLQSMFKIFSDPPVINLERHVSAKCTYSNTTMLNLTSTARFQGLTAASMNMTVSWGVALCSLVEVY
jgi:hypothetical protein